MIPAVWLACGGDDRPRRPAAPTGTELAGETPTTPHCGGVLDTIDLPGRITPSIGVRITLREPGVAHVICTADDDPTDRVLVEARAPSDAPEVVVLGLRPDTVYTCEAFAGCGGPKRTFVHHTGIPDGVPRFTVERDPAEAPTGAYTLFNTQRGCFGGAPQIVIVDPEGRVRWTWALGEPLVCDLDATFVPPDRVHVGGGWGLFDPHQPNRGVFRTVDLEGNTVLERDRPDFGLGFNHHSQPLPDGSYVSLTGTENTAAGREFFGVGVEWWHPDEGLRWTFSSQSLLDSGQIPPPPAGEDLPFHANAVRLVEDDLGAGAWISLYSARRIWRIDRDTGALLFTFGVDGDFTLADPAGRPLPDSQFPWVQHDPEYSDDHRILVYDNGQDRPGGARSRVAEFALDPERRRATLSWEWTEPGWYDPIVGDADWLPDGRVLVTRGFSREWTPGSDDTSQIVELEPPDHVIWRLRWPDGGWITFRAQRIDGCDLFANARYCPAVADRIAALHPAG